MKHTIKTCLRSAIISALPVTALSQNCDMSQITRHGDNEMTRIYSSDSGHPALYFVADMDVNTDGAARSYHPDDPQGKTIALNNIGNAISQMYDVNERNITCSPRRGACYSRFITTFEQARDAKFAPTGAPRVETRWIIPWKIDKDLGWETPCVIQDGPNAGYFVSQTSVIVDSSKDECDQRRYLDSMTFNANVLPKGINWRSQGVITDGTDLVIARDLDTDVVAYGLNGDRGPANKIGEGSIAFAAALSKAELVGSETYSEIRSLARRNVQYLIFPREDIRREVGDRFTQEDIDRIGARVFAEWGGVDRLDACKGKPR